jgi:hypothetical protein
VGTDADDRGDARWLLKLGYREDVDVVLGVRFTQGDIQALLAAAHEVDRILSPFSVSLNIPGLILDAAVQQGIPTMFIDKCLVGAVRDTTKPDHPRCHTARGRARRCRA